MFIFGQLPLEDLEEKGRANLHMFGGTGITEAQEIVKI
jgi:hypothetical protein